jgi:hypothetical protein
MIYPPHFVGLRSPYSEFLEVSDSQRLKGPNGEEAKSNGSEELGHSETLSVALLI